jgi:hypothetical protein
MSQKENIGRRKFVLAAVAAAPAALVLRSAGAAELPHAAETDAAAAALGYKLDATTVDTAKYKQYKAGAVCSGCRYFQGKAGDQFGPCTILPGKAVHASGWCSVFAAK